MTFKVTVTNEDGTLWATVENCPGVFASGDNMDELLESLGEALSLVITPEEVAAAATLDSMVPPAPHHAEGRTLQLC